MSRDVRVFLSGVASRTHLLYAASYLHHLLDTTTAEVTVVNLGLRPFLGRANVSVDDVTTAMPRHPRLHLAPLGAGPKAPRGHDVIYLAIGAPGLKPYLRLRAAHPGRRIRVVTVDEGLGSYGGWRSRRAAWVRESGRQVWPTVRALAVAAAGRWLTDLRWSLYRHGPQGWEVNGEVAAGLRPRPAHGQSLSDHWDGSSRELVGPPPVVYLSQPWVELSVVGCADYLAHLAAVRRACEVSGSRLAIRPHPAEQAERYAGYEVLDHGAPAELDPCVIGARAVIGSSSTALLNLAAIHAVPAFRVRVPGLTGLDQEMSPDQQGLLDAFLPEPIEVAQLADRLSGADRESRHPDRTYPQLP